MLVLHENFLFVKIRAYNIFKDLLPYVSLIVLEFNVDDSLSVLCACLKIVGFYFEVDCFHKKNIERVNVV